jgi:hypothetical protein
MQDAYATRDENRIILHIEHWTFFFHVLSWNNNYVKTVTDWQGFEIIQLQPCRYMYICMYACIYIYIYIYIYICLPFHSLHKQYFRKPAWDTVRFVLSFQNEKWVKDFHAFCIQFNFLPSFIDAWHLHKIENKLFSIFVSSYGVTFRNLSFRFVS